MKCSGDFRTGLLIKTLTCAIMFAATNAAAQAPVSDPRKIEARLKQLERSMSGSSLVKMHQTLQN